MLPFALFFNSALLILLRFVFLVKEKITTVHGFSVGLQYILDSSAKGMQGKRQSVIVELLHKTVRKEHTLRGNYNTGYEV